MQMNEIILSSNCTNCGRTVAANLIIDSPGGENIFLEYDVYFGNAMQSRGSGLFRRVRWNIIIVAR